MAAAPAVSVLLPVRDALPYLPACRRSLARQSLRDFEVVAVDDGSNDGTGAFLAHWAREDPRVRVLSPGRVGLVEALNRGLAACRAPLVARMDADDACHPLRLELQAAYLERHPEVGLVASRVRFFPVHRVAGGFLRYEAWLNGLLTHGAMMRERFAESPVAHPSVMLPRKVLQAAGGYRDLGWPEDHDLWLRLAAAGIRFAKLPEVLVFLREHPGRLTRTDPRYSTRAFLELKAHHLLAGPLAGGRPFAVWGAGPTGRRLASLLLEGGGRLEAFVDIDPAKVGRTARGVPILAPETVPGLAAGGGVILAAVASRGARELIRARLARLGLREGRDWWAVA